MIEARPSFAILYHGNVGIRFLSTLYGNQLCLVHHCKASIVSSGPNASIEALGLDKVGGGGAVEGGGACEY